jgi:hypothetical protein
MGQVVQVFNAGRQTQAEVVQVTHFDANGERLNG